MPLYKTIMPTSNIKVLIWKIEESYDDLRQGIELTPNCKDRLSHMKSEIHQRGFLSVRHLLKAAGYVTSDLYYDANGKPHLKDGNYISITHSFIFSGIIVSSNTNIGIDIEKQRNKISVIANKFVNYEYNFLTDKDVRKLTIVWCVKESLYKVFATEGMSFKQHTKVISFDLEEGNTIGWVFYHGIIKKYKVEFLEFDGFTCAYVMQVEKVES